MYAIIDTYGTKRTAWTLKGAREWLPFCSPHAVIYNRLSRRVIMSRSFYRVY
jgi:hypothetical protein